MVPRAFVYMECIEPGVHNKYWAAVIYSDGGKYVYQPLYARIGASHPQDGGMRRYSTVAQAMANLSTMVRSKISKGYVIKDQVDNDGRAWTKSSPAPKRIPEGGRFLEHVARTINSVGVPACLAPFSGAEKAPAEDFPAAPPPGVAPPPVNPLREALDRRKSLAIL
jgi:hypothetical protein